jgi:arginyl-tRNA--protein-N-Asp/Glu arginylyltransferase
MHPQRYRLSTVELGGPEHTSSCGYCKGPSGAKSRTSASFGVSAPALTCVDYQGLCDAGWRRSGDYLYTLSNDRTCCPALTIRLDTRQFAPDREHRRLVRRLNQYLRGEVAAVQGSGSSSAAEGVGMGDGGGGGSGGGGGAGAAAAPPAPADPLPGHLDAALRAAAAAAFPDLQLTPACLVCRAPPQVLAGKGAAAAAAAGGGCAPSYSSAVAHQLRAAAAKRAAAAAGPSPVPPAADFAARLVAAAGASEHLALSVAPSGHINIALPLGGVPIGGALRAPPPPPAPPPSSSSSAAAAAAAAPPPPPAPAFPPHTWEVRVVPAVADQESFDLYRRYQVAVHRDDPARLTMAQFSDFLCASPLVREPWGAPAAAAAAAQAAADAAAPGAPPGDRALAARAALVAAAWEAGEGGGAGLPLLGAPLPAAAAAAAAAADDLAWLAGFPRDREHVFPDLLPPAGGGGGGGGGAAPSLLAQGYGTFHHKYYLDGALVAVGVVDVLPHALSSVYVFYDPELARSTLPLGKLTALREIQWVQAVCRRPCLPPPPPVAAAAAPAPAAPAAAALLSAASPRLCYYYLGFYIHACPKMRYKAEYSPSELLCPVTRAAWVRHEAALGALEASKCPTLAPGAEAAAWAEGARAREAGLGVALARAAFCFEGGGGSGGGSGGGAHVCTQRELRDGPPKARLLALLREQWLPKAGPAVSARCVVRLG